MRKIIIINFGIIFFILADYNLDVDSPYPIPTAEELQQKPKKLEYPSYDNEYKFYGKSILQLIDKAISLPEGEEKRGSDSGYCQQYEEVV